METLFPFFQWTNLLIIPGLFIGYTVHELGHAFTAYWLGDTSQVDRGGITLNPFKHISWFGFIFFVIFGLGWPKPMRANPANFKRGYLDLCMVALAGPFASLTFGLAGLLLTLVIAAVLVFFSGVSTNQVFPYLFPWGDPPLQTLNLQAISIAFTGYIALPSFALFFMSLLPLPGLDGFAAIICLLAFFRQRQKGKQSLPQPLTFDRLASPAPSFKRRNRAAEIHLKAGAQFHQASQYEDAIARYQQALHNDEHYGPAYVNMGLAYLAKGDRKKAIRAFRGATQYADDQKSQVEAWQQLHQLSQVSPSNEEIARENMAEMGGAPWTDTQPRPNWFRLGFSSAVLLIGAIGFYSYLLTQLVGLLKA
jgi:Zn-dependent protease